MEELLIHLDREGRIVDGGGRYIFDWTNGAFFSAPKSWGGGEVSPALPGRSSERQGSGQALSNAPPCT